MIISRTMKYRKYKCKLEQIISLELIDSLLRILKNKGSLAKAYFIISLENKIFITLLNAIFTEELKIGSKIPS